MCSDCGVIDKDHTRKGTLSLIKVEFKKSLSKMLSIFFITSKKSTCRWVLFPAEGEERS